jgi:hypothetical protein
MKVWMRVAAVLLLVAAMGVLYFNSNNNIDTPSTNGTVASSGQKQAVPSLKKETPDVKNNKENVIDNGNSSIKNEDLLASPESNEKKKPVESSQDEIVIPGNEPELVAQNDQERIRPEQRPVQALDINQPAVTMGSIDISRENTLLNNLAVTSDEDGTYNNTNAAAQNTIAAGNNESKGSVKGFLRRATRLIEKRTGIDPTTDGELLIGVVAVKLK